MDKEEHQAVRVAKKQGYNWTTTSKQQAANGVHLEHKFVLL